MKMWAGRFKKELNKDVNDFNSSIKIDHIMYESDILGSIAHANMLQEQGIINNEEGLSIIITLEEILKDLNKGILEFDIEAEDIHMFIEAELTKRIGDVGKKLHTARSRNDQIALDIRMHLKNEIENTKKLLKKLIETIIKIAIENTKTIMPGYTHLQRAQPVTFAHHILAYSNMFLRDIDRLNDCYKRTNYMPLGACALAGTTYNTNRNSVASKLGFSSVTLNSMDSVSDRDFVIELANSIALIMMHLSRFSEEIILWCSWEFKFIELDDSYSTGSSIMPQKKNPDIAELVRGKTGRCYGNLISLLTMMKGLPLSYNKDMQEDKEAIFDSVDTVKTCLSIFDSMIDTMKINKENMLNAAKKGYINATDVADYLVTKGLPFRDAYKISGTIVSKCIEMSISLEEYSLENYQQFSSLFKEDLFNFISLENSLSKRTSFGGPAENQVLNQIELIKSELNKYGI